MQGLSAGGQLMSSLIFVAADWYNFRHCGWYISVGRWAVAQQEACGSTPVEVSAGKQEVALKDVVRQPAQYNHKLIMSMILCHNELTNLA